MGSCHSSSEEEEEKKIVFENYDSSFIYSAILVLYNIEKFKKFLIEKELPEDSKKKLSILLKKIFLKEEKKINLEKYSKRIYKILTEFYKLDVGKTPGKIIIQILEILNYEESKIVNSWDDLLIQNPQLFMNTCNQYSSFQDYKNNYKNKNVNGITKLFFGDLLMRRKLNMNILYFYDSFCALEINLKYCYDTFPFKGRNVKNPRTQKDEIHLLDCILDLKTANMGFYNGIPCLVEYHIFTPAPYLIIVFNRENENGTYYGNINFPDKINFFDLIINKENNKTYLYELVSIIKEKKYIVKKRNKNEKSEDINDWVVDDGSNNNNKNDGVSDKYLAIFQKEDKKYYYLDQEKKMRILKLGDLVDDYYIHILVYKNAEFK